MTDRPRNELVRYLRRAALRHDDAGLTDGLLLAWFIERREEAAFEALVRRHGPMVLGVCRRILRDPHDADDAFQATFLVLVRKAATVLPRDRVGHWLYGVARTTALRAKSALARRRTREQPVPAPPEVPAAARDPWDDLGPVIDEELRRLPEKYRVPIVLCDLQGKTHKDAARHAGWAVGTLSGRLSRARALLAGRLARRGLGLPAAAVGSLLCRNASARVPAAVLAPTLDAARRLTAGQALAAGVTTARVAALTKGVLNMMLVARLKAALAPVFFAACLGVAALPVVGYGQKDGAKEPPAAPAAAAVDPKQLLQKCSEACRNVKQIEYVEEQRRADTPAQPPRSVATIRQARADIPDAGFLPGKFAVDGEATEPGAKPRRFAFAYDGATLRVLDPAEKVVSVVRGPDARRAARLLGGDGMAGLPQFTQSKPFQNLIDRATAWEYRGTRDVKGTTCHVVALTVAIENDPRGPTTSLWFIGRDDHLPRGNEVGRVQKLLTIRAVNDKVAAREYTVATPAGHTETLVTGDEAQVKALLPVGSPAPDWTLTDPQGRTHALKDYRGQVVLLDFWGTWCVPCRKAMPDVQALHERFKDQGVRVFGVAVGDDEGDPAGYVKRQGYTYTLLLKGDAVAAAYKAVTLPTVYVIGRDGKVAHAEYGSRETMKADLTAILEKGLKAGGK